MRKDSIVSPQRDWNKLQPFGKVHFVNFHKQTFIMEEYARQKALLIFIQCLLKNVNKLLIYWDKDN